MEYLSVFYVIFVLQSSVVLYRGVISKFHSFDIGCWHSSVHTLLYWWSVWCHWSWWLWWRTLQATMS